MTEQKRFQDYKEWHYLQCATDDIDPVYPVMWEMAQAWGLSRDERAWLCIAHVVYYHLGSTMTLFRRVEHLRDLPTTLSGLDDLGLLSLPTATERRGHRDQAQLGKHLLGLQAMEGQPLAWLGANGWDWPSLNDRITQLVGNGRWAAYKLAEMLQKVADVPTFATDAGHKHSSGPRKGLNDLFEDMPQTSDNSPAAIAILDAYTRGLAGYLGETDIARVETSLCDFHSLVKGGYYLGHDIDSMQEQLLSPRVDPGEEVWWGRDLVFPAELLGEQNSWTGVRRELKRVYKDTGVVDARKVAA